MRMPFHLSLAIALLSTAQAQAAQRQGESGQRPILYAGQPDALRVSLSAERYQLFVGEPLHLRLEIRNESAETLIGYFIRAERTERQYRHPRMGSFTELRTTPPEEERRRATIHGVVVPSLLEPGETATRQITLAAHGNGGLILDEPGGYQFKVLCRLARDRPELVLSSNLVSIQVNPARAAHQEALAAYLAEGLPAFVQASIIATETRPGLSLKAAEFLDRYPHSPYAEPLRKPLLDVVRDRVLRGKATEREREIYDRLEPTDPHYRPPERPR